ncbi:hypothetical protein M5K25_010640 [Dendrobium thyrsiflorum]|uniref:Uncharacterized protein n=1 Tax=Dendrobium thyrsiflorum TaxID=117978 RepID=A0ABD0V7W2_DENTH
MKKMIEDKQKPATSKTTGGHGRGGNPNPFRGRENPEVEVLEGSDGMPHLEPLSREDMSMGYDRRWADFVGRREEFHCRGAEFEGRREEIQRRVEYKHLIGFPTDFSLFFLCWLLSTAENSSFLAVFPIRFGRNHATATVIIGKTAGNAEWSHHPRSSRPQQPLLLALIKGDRRKPSRSPSLPYSKPTSLRYKTTYPPQAPVSTSAPLVSASPLPIRTAPNRDSRTQVRPNSSSRHQTFVSLLLPHALPLRHLQPTASSRLHLRPTRLSAPPDPCSSRSLP